MAAESGRDIRVEYDSGSGYAVVAGARTDSLTVNNEMIDITTKDNAGVRTLLDDIGLKSMSLSCTGVATSVTFASLAAAATEDASLHDFRLTFGSFATYTGSFFITTFEASGEQDGVITFSMSLESSGTITAA